MTDWQRTISIKQHLDPAKPFEDVRDVIVGVLRNDRAYLDGFDFTGIVDEMAEVETVQDFDWCLSALYDWADAHLVWIGPTWTDPVQGEVGG
jgi:hypothetical protein